MSKEPAWTARHTERGRDFRGCSMRTANGEERRPQHHHLACTECRERTYTTTKNRRNDPDRLELTSSARAAAVIGLTGRCARQKEVRMSRQLRRQPVAAKTRKAASDPPEPALAEPTGDCGGPRVGPSGLAALRPRLASRTSSQS